MSTYWLGIVAAAGLALVAAACTSHVGSAQRANRWVTFSGCMRSNGVSRYPDPDRTGRPPKKSLQDLGVSGSRFQSAEAACRHLLPNGGVPPSLVAQQHVRANALRFARCVRAHGVAGFPDPASDGRIPDPASVGIDQGSPKFEAANTACRAFRPPYMPSNAAYTAWARTQGG